MAERVGSQLGNYRLLRLIGRGNFAEVYLAEHLHLGTQAAIKVLPTHFTDEDSERFLAEARTMARLLHPKIVRTLDFDVEDGVPFLIMEYAPNGTLRQRHPQGTQLPLDIIVLYVRQVAEALHYIHQQKLIHRDVRPESMLLGRNEEVLLTEFGSTIVAQSTRSQPIQEAVGSAIYTAPEQILGKPRPASDQYALAVVVYEWLSGVPPFSGSVHEIANQHLSVLSPPLQTKVPTIPTTVESVVLKALAKNPEQRFMNVQAFANALEEAFDGELRERTVIDPFSAHLDEEQGQKSLPLSRLPTGTVTMLFTDIEGSTRLLQQLGDRYVDVLSRCRQLFRATFQEWGGHEVDTQGDAFFVAFARATDAVLAAVAAQRALVAHHWPEGVAVRLRMGLHTGEPALTPEGYVGLDVPRAARIMSAAHGGQVLLSQTTCNLVEQDLPDEVGLRDLGEHRLKDLGRPKRLFQLVISNLPADFPPLKTLDTSPNNLPTQYTPFIGREQEVAAVGQLLRREDVRLLTLTGPGGTGKTRLGLQVAAELTDLFADGVYFVSLAPISDPALVVPAIAEALGTREGAGQTLLKRLEEYLQQKRMLLLLDNFEQVVSAGMQMVDLLSACPRLKILVTSREVLHLQAEHEFAVPPLPLPDPKRLPDLAALSHYAAVALFVSRAQAVKPDFALSDTNARAVTEICIRLDGLPLAIELAAARIKLLPPQALLARMNQRLTMLTGTSRDVPARQQTLRNTIAWSYDLLTANEQRLFRRLSVFVGGCSLEAIEALSTAPDDEPGAVLDGVASLIDKSLLRQTQQEGEEPRFVMLETIREFGLQALSTCSEREVVEQAHATYYLHYAEETEAKFAGRQEAIFDRLEWEHENLRAALNWWLVRAEGEMASRLAKAFGAFWLFRCHWSEGRNFLERILALTQGRKTLLRARVLESLSVLLLSLGELARAEELDRESLALARKLGDTEYIAGSLHILAIIVADQGNFAAAHPLFEECVALSREAGENFRLPNMLCNWANLAIRQGEYERARTLAEEGLALYREQGRLQDIPIAFWSLAEVSFCQGNLAQAYVLVKESLELCIEKENFNRPDLLSLLGEIVLQQGDAARTRILAEESLTRYKEVGDTGGICESLTLLGRVASTKGNDAAARSFYEQSLQIARERGFKWESLSALEGIASVVASQGELTWAARLWGAAEALREALGAPIPPIYRTDYERSIAAARAQLGEQALVAAWAEGRGMTRDQVLAARGPVTISLPVPSTQPVTLSPEQSSPTYPDGLTAREVEVLRLVAQGLSNAEIAEQLIISLLTVKAHIRSLYNKLGISSRSAATRYAIEHHLT